MRKCYNFFFIVKQAEHFFCVSRQPIINSEFVLDGGREEEKKIKTYRMKIHSLNKEINQKSRVFHSECIICSIRVVVM